MKFHFLQKLIPLINNACGETFFRFSQARMIALDTPFKNCMHTYGGQPFTLLGYVDFDPPSRRDPDDR